MKKQKTINVSALKKALKTGMTFIQLKENYVYLSDSHFVLKMPKFYYDEEIRSITNYFFTCDCTAQKNNDNEYKETTTDIKKFLDDCDNENAVLTTVKVIYDIQHNMEVQIVKGKNLVALNTKYIEIMGSPFEWECTANGSKTPVVFNNSICSLMILPINFNFEKISDIFKTE